MAGSRNKVLEIVDGNGTKLTVSERRVSEWQRDLRLRVEGTAVGEQIRAGAKHVGAVPIRSPVELADLSGQLSSFLSDRSQNEAEIKLRPHRRLAGVLRRDARGMTWTVDRGYNAPSAVRVDEDALLQLIDFATAYS